MSGLFIRGVGAVSPAGWGVDALAQAVTTNADVPVKSVASPNREFQARTVPTPTTRPAALNHPRLRRASGISQYAIAAAAEALGENSAREKRLGIVVASHVASIRYTERFFAEALRDPATASPMLFPETVVNASASHLAAALGPCALTYSLLGDQTVVFQAILTAATWLAQDRADLVLVVGAEECGWNVAAAMHLFARNLVCSEGAGALLLSREGGPGSVEIESISAPRNFVGKKARRETIGEVRCSDAGLIVDSQTGLSRWDAAVPLASCEGERFSPRKVLGESLAAGTAWQFVLAARLVKGTATVVTVGSNHQAMMARLKAGK